MSLCVIGALLFTFIVVGICLSILWWGIQGIPASWSPLAPATFGWIVRLIFALLCIVAIIEIFTGKLDLGGRLFGC